MDDLLLTLTDAQRDAVTHDTGPCLVVAGPGTGKTKVITTRIAYLVQERGVAPEKITALTFTDKAAREMEERLDQLLPYGVTGVNIATFHSFCKELLSRHAVLLGLDPSAALLSTADELSFLRQHVTELPTRLYKPARNPLEFLRLLLGFMSKARDENLPPERIVTHAQEKRAQALDDADREEADKLLELAHCYAAVEQLYAENSFLTYGDLVYYATRLLAEFPSVRKAEGERIDFLLVDEFQDTNFIQNEVARLLVERSRSIMAVGDDDQAIYQFRGANLGNILAFTTTFPDARLITLTDNFRSTQAILDASYRLIQANNPARLEVQENLSKRLASHRQYEHQPEHHHFAHSTFEHQFIAETIQDLLGEYRPEDVAILVRSKAQVAGIETALRAKGILSQFSGDAQFYHLPTVRVAAAWLRFLANPHQDVNLFFLLSQEPFEVEERLLHKLTNAARYQTVSLYDYLLEHPDEEDERLQTALAYLRQQLAGSAMRRPSELLLLFLKTSGWHDRLAADENPEPLDQLTTLYGELGAVEQENRMLTVQEYVQHLDYLLSTDEEISLSSSQEVRTDGVQILTVHKSKGLEFPVVFVTNLAQGRFPSRNYGDRFPFPYELSGNPAPGSQSNLPEERRLAYVAMTRAKDRLYLTSSEQYGEGKLRLKLSPFVIEALGLQAPPSAQAREMEEMLPAEAPPPDPSPVSYPAASSFSVSELETYQQCPLRYKYQYVLKVRTPSSAAANFGTSLHRTLQTWFEAKQHGLGLDLDETYQRSWIPGGYFSKEAELERYHDGLEKLRAYLATQEGLPAPQYLEQTFQTRRPDGSTIVGKIDRVDRLPGGGMKVIDYKTGERPLSPKELREHMPLYSYAQELIARGEPVEEVELQYVMAGESVRVPVASLDKELIEQGISATVEAIRESSRKNAFPAKPDRFLCGYCDYKDICPFRWGAARQGQ